MKWLSGLILLLLSKALLAASPVWRIESADNQLFLAGTIHLLRPSDYPLPDTFETAYRQSQAIAFETDVAEIHSPAFAQQLIQALILPPNQSLKQFLSASTLSRLNKYLQSHHLALDSFASYKPSMIAMTLVTTEMKRLGATGQGVDDYYHARATKDHKKTLALETAQQQLEFLASLGKGMEDEMIQQTLDEISTLSNQFALMVKSWKNGDNRQMEKLFIEPMQQQFDPVYQQLLVKRNLAWLPQIEQYLNTAETEMVLVGSAHLIGQDGLLKKLKQAGYKVTQLD